MSIKKEIDNREFQMTIFDDASNIPLHAYEMCLELKPDMAYVPKGGRSRGWLVRYDNVPNPFNERVVFIWQRELAKGSNRPTNLIQGLYADIATALIKVRTSPQSKQDPGELAIDRMDFFSNSGGQKSGEQHISAAQVQ